ncbi:hypothetical protein TNCV_2982781 [Trichonephila clavipes]|nr:hypothetical protein TNCV_2982781 [Trichonephila clavipes]
MNTLVGEMKAKLANISLGIKYHESELEVYASIFYVDDLLGWSGGKKVFGFKTRNATQRRVMIIADPRFTESEDELWLRHQCVKGLILGEKDCGILKRIINPSEK